MLFKVDKHMFYYFKKEDSNYMGCTDVHIQFVVLHFSEYFQIKIKWGWGGEVKTRGQFEPTFV